MGYTTDFYGSFRLDRPMQLEHARYLHAFRSRRMRRDAHKAATLPDRIRAAVGLPVGDEGGYCVAGSHDNDPSVVDGNRPPQGQPGLWCQWMPSEDHQAIVWDGCESFSYYVEWLEYVIAHFLGPWGYVLNGVVRWEGEEPGDTGTIHVVNNRVTTQETEDNRDHAEWGVED
jgi:hypothetical protein